MLPPAPQSGRQPAALADDDRRRLLRRRRRADQTDLYATDANPEIRALGLLALRRSDINDLFALGDLCARRILTDDGRLRVFYVGKALAAYQKALQTAASDDDRALARRMIDALRGWTAQAAHEYPTPRNIAAALWALAEGDGAPFPLAEGDLRALFDTYSAGLALTPASAEEATRADIGQDLTAADVNLSFLLSQSQVTAPDAAGSADSIYSQPDNDPVAPLEGLAQPAALSELTSVERDAGGPLHELDISKRRRPARADDEFHQGDRIEGRYEVADVRRGGMGVVYLCYDLDQHEPVAIKSFQARFLENERAVIRFYNEAHTWIRLEKHHHIVQARLVQNINSRPHLILEHISGPEGLGPDLKSWIDHHRLSTALAVEFGLHIALGMQHAVRQVPGLVHRDLKPANILVTHDAIAKVTDFGLVRSVEGEHLAVDNQPPDASPNTQLTRVGAVVGTAPYMSPEQCRSQRVDLRSDIYAFGCLLYEMLTGRPVFDARKFADWMDAHLHRVPLFPRQARALPAPLLALALACLEKTPENRPASWSEIVTALSTIYTDITGKPAVMEATGPALEARELMDKGYSLTELGHLDEALEAYNRAIVLQPDYAWAWARKGRTLRLLSRFADALVCYDRALEIQPRYAFAWNGKGIVLERMGQLEQALACYEKAAQINPTDVWHWCNQADVLQSMGRYREAVALLGKALQMDPAHPNSWAKLGQMLRLLGDYQESARAYEQAVRLDPEYAWAHNGYGLSLRALDRLPAALAAFKRAAQYQPDEVWHWYNITETLIDLKQYQDAVYTAQQATRTDPTHSHSWSKLGQVLRYVHRYDEALIAYDRAIALQPDYNWALNGKGMALEALDRLDEALACYRQAAQHDQQDAWYTFYNQGNILVKMRRYDEALPLLEQTVKINPAHARGWARLGSVLRNLRRFEEALVALQQATQQAPAYAWAWSEKGITFEALGQPEDALRCYRQAAAAAPHDPLYVYQQADALVYLNQYVPALELLDQALQKDSRSARIWAKHG